MFSSTPRFAESSKIITPKKSTFLAKNDNDTSSKTKLVPLEMEGALLI